MSLIVTNDLAHLLSICIFKSRALMVVMWDTYLPLETSQSVEKHLVNGYMWDLVSYAALIDLNMVMDFLICA